MLGEGPITKGGHNPPNTGSQRPAAPQGRNRGLLEQRLAEVEAKYATLLECVRVYADKGNWLGHVFNTFPSDGYEPAQACLEKIKQLGQQAAKGGE